MKKIITKRLELRPLTDQCADDVFAILLNEEVKQTYMIPDFESKEDAMGLFHRMKELSERTDRYVCGLFLQDTCIGFINDVDSSKEYVELGYALHPKWHGMGYATEAVTAVVEELLNQGVECVKAAYFEENVRSRRVMEKSGMIPTEETEDIEYRGKVHHCLYMEKRR